jgi:hypothetical protein
MSRSPKPDQLQQLEEMRAACVAILRFLETQHILSPAEQFYAAVQRAYEHENLRGLRAAHADLLQRVQGLSSAEQEALAVELRAAGATSEPHEALDRALREVITRGVLRTGDEYRLVQARLEQIHDDPAHADEAVRLTALLSEAHDRSLLD